MAKKKKHKIRKPKKQNKVVKNTTKNINDKPSYGIYEESSSAASEIEQNSVISDVKFSLIVLGIIILCFIILYAILQNKSVSDQIYGIIKINL